MSSALVKEWEKAIAARTSGHFVQRLPDDIIGFAKSVGIEPDPWQEDVLSSEHPRKILCCGRQTGKSTVASVLAIHNT